jgi:hypothetical protein
LLSGAVRTELDTQNTPYGLTSAVWTNGIGNLLYTGPDMAATVISAIPHGGTDLLQSLANYPIVTGTSAFELYRQVSCREIADTITPSGLPFVFSHGLLVPDTSGETYCGPLHLTNPFDSSQLQFSVKAYYFIGDTDVATPPDQGVYHFEHHQGRAVRVVTLRGGHA